MKKADLVIRSCFVILLWAVGLNKGASSYYANVIVLYCY